MMRAKVKGGNELNGIGNYLANPKKIPLYPPKNWRVRAQDSTHLSRKFLHHLMDYVGTVILAKIPRVQVHSMTLLERWPEG